VGDGDPLALRFALPLVKTCFPMGFPVEIATNSPEVLRAADEVWAGYPQMWDARAAELHVAVEGVSGGLELQPSPRGRGHLVSIVQSAGNFAVADLSRGYSFAWLTRDVAADHRHTRYHFLEPLVYLMVDALYLAPLHASCVALNGRAVVLCGNSGAGKTSLAYACAHRGWSYLSDDATHVVRGRKDFTVVGRPHAIRFRESARRLFPELDGFAPVRRPNGKSDLEIEPKSLGIETAYQAEARWIVFPDRQAAPVAASVRKFSRAEARESLEMVLCYGDTRTRAEQKAALRRFLRLPVVRLTYYDAGEAEALLRRLLSGEMGAREA
jgi:hypothetical protein